MFVPNPRRATEARGSVAQERSGAPDEFRGRIAGVDAADDAPAPSSSALALRPADDAVVADAAERQTGFITSRRTAVA